MRVLPKTGLVAAPLLVLFALGCQPSSSGNPGPAGQGSGASSAGGGANVGGSATLPDGTQAASLLPARIRRLTDAEYQATVSAVVGDSAKGIADDFVPDSRQGGFTVNEAQRVDPVLARQLAEAAIKLAADVRTHAAERAPCANVSAGADPCADAFIRGFGAKAYRRPLADDEVTQLMTVFHTGLQGGSYEEGIELVARAMLQSAAFLYLTEIGEAAAATIKLTPYELASSISYLVLGGPPSQDLQERALRGELDTPEGRKAYVEGALFLGPAAGDRTVRVIREWLGTDRISATAKDSTVYPAFNGVKNGFEQETYTFVNNLVADGRGSLAQLLAADWTQAPSEVLTVYGVAGPADSLNRTRTPKRLGILNQGAFLSVFSHAHETAPVLRGVAVMRRVACSPILDPVGLATAIVPPAPDKTKTTRERFAAHATPGCAACHDRIDNFGFAFESFDGMGAWRDRDNDQPVNATVVVTGTDFDGPYADSNALVTAMSTSPQVRECFARHMFRAFAGTSVEALKPSEDDFVKYWETVSKDANGQMADVFILDTIRAFVKSPSFNFRRAQ